MSNSKNVYAVLRASGRPMDLTRTANSDTLESGPYLSILNHIAVEQSSAGSNYDSPSQLFLNGKCVVEKGLASLAWHHQDDKRAASNAVADAVRDLHSPDWLPADELKPGFQGHGVAKWKVEKLTAIRQQAAAGDGK